MLRSFKKLISLVLVFALSLAVSLPAFAVEPTDSQTKDSGSYIIKDSGAISPDKVLSEVFAALNLHDYNSYFSLTACLCNNGQAGENNAHSEHIGVYGLDKIKLTKCKEIDATEKGVEDVIQLSNYQSQYSNLHIYSVALDCQPYNENEYFFKGINYFLCVVGYDGSEYKLLQMSQPMWSEVSSTVRFHDSDENIQIFIQNERQKGNIIGSNGKLLSVNRMSEQELAKEENISLDVFRKKHPEYSKYIYKGLNGKTVSEYLKSNNLLKAEETLPGSCPSTIKVYITSSGRIMTVNFSDYVKNVVSNEWLIYENGNRWYGMPSQAMYAGALACKGYGWYRVRIKKYSGYDVKNSQADQVYNPSKTPASSAVNAFNFVNGRIIVNKSNKLFPTYYQAGAYNSNGANGGMAYQNGAAYLANSSTYYDCYQILYYYYNGVANLGNSNHG